MEIEDYTFADFLRAQMEKRSMSANKFAEFVGVTHTTINRFLNSDTKDIGYPSTEFIVKLAKATDSDIGLLLKLVEPDVPYAVPELSPKARHLAEQIEQLSERQRQVVESLLEVLRESGGA